MGGLHGLGGLQTRSMMRIGFIVPGSLDNHSGGFLYDRMLVEHLRRLGMDVDVFPFRWASYPVDLLRNLSRPSHREFDPMTLDVLLEDELSHAGLLSFNRRLRRQAGLPIIAVVHHLRSSEARPTWINDVYRRIEGSYLAGVDAAICNSRATQRTVETLWPSTRPSLVAYPGREHLERRINPGEVRARALQVGPMRLVFLGNVIPRKGLLTLIQALSTISARDWQLEIIGDLSIDPAYVRQIRRAIAQAGLERKVTFDGRLDAPSLAARLTEGHVIVVPSTFEGFGIAYLDGMAYGLPAVATTAGGAGELVRHGHNGLLIAPGDAEALAREIAGLIDDRPMLADMSVAALETYREHPSWGDSAESVLTFLSGLKNKAEIRSKADRRSHHFTIAGGSP